MSRHHVIESLDVEGGLFFHSLHAEFDPRHNDFIGEFGTGKSGIIHFVTYALDAKIVLPDPDEHEEYVRDTLGAGTITLRVRSAHGVPYKVTRKYGEPPQVWTADDVLADVSLDGDLFKIHAYGAGALALIARNLGAQLDLIDDFAVEDVRRVTAQIASVERDLGENAVARRRLALDIAEDEEKVTELATVEEALKGITVAGGRDAEASVKAHARKIERGRERTAMTALGKEIATARAALGTFAAGTLRRLGAAVEGELERGQNAEVFRRAHETVQRAAGAIEKRVALLGAELAEAESGAADHAHALAAAHATEEAAYQALVVAEDTDRVRAAERERLHRRFEELSVANKRLGDRRRELGERLRDRDRLRDARTLLYRERWAIRDAVAQDLTKQLKGRIRVRVAQAAGGSAYLALLLDLLRGSGIREAVVKRIAKNIRPAKLLALIEADDPGPIEEVDNSKTDRPARARKVLDALRASERKDELETVPMGDVPTIELRVGNGFQPSGRVSHGQRCTCILPILLLLPGGPLLIDQPEDNLDNKFIFAVLVSSMAEVKERRQLIFATHNANIVVLDPADRVFVLVTKPANEAGKEGEGEDEEGVVGSLAACGDVDAMREWIEKILEGGREAFLRRGERYGHVKRQK